MSPVVIRRRLHDGSVHRVVKVPLTPADLERRLELLGWQPEVKPTRDGSFLWGVATRAAGAPSRK